MQPNPSNRKAILIDGTYLVFRAFSGSLALLKYTQDRQAPPINAIKITFLMLFKLLSNPAYQYGMIAFDHKEKSYRSNLYAGYKQNRTTMAFYPDLIAQLNYLTTNVHHFGISAFAIPGYEADDLVGSAVNYLTQQGVYCDVYSNDKDYLQLVSPLCSVYQFAKGTKKMVEINYANFATHMQGLKPEQVVDFKALFGDKSDNLQGIKGIGEKTAIALLQKYGSLQNIYEQLATITQPALQKKLQENKQAALLSQKLATLMVDYFTLNQQATTKLQLQAIDLTAVSQLIDALKLNKQSFAKYLAN